MEITSLPEPIILIVDDKQINITVLTEILEGMAQIYFLTSGRDTVVKAAELLPDVILLDIEMPDMNGFEVFSALSADPRTADISVIFISAHTEAEIEFVSLASGAVDFIGRPFNRAICRQRVKNHLQLQRSKKSLFEESQRFSVALNSIGDAVIATDVDGHITFMNPIAESMTGWREVEAMGQPVDLVMCLQDADSKKHMTNPLRIAMQEKRRVAMALNCELLAKGSSIAIGVEDSAAPIFDSSGKLTGGIVVFNDVSETRAMALKMTYLANHDQLTGLPNRVLLYDRINLACQIARSTGNKVSVLIIDIDRFKFINDAIGHQDGDELIRQVANRISSVLEPECTIARLGGDEFVLICPEVENLEHISSLAGQIIRQMSLPLVLNDSHYSLTLSIGISVFPDDSSSDDELMRHADLALFEAKKEGRNRFHFFSDELGHILMQHHRQEQALRESIKNQQIEVHYQPIVDLKNGRIHAAEALARIKNPDGSLLSPLHFIPLAEETGLIVPLGKQVLFKACQQAKKWLDSGYEIPVSVNIAAAQFADKEFLMSIKQTLTAHQLPPHLLKLEVTETALILDPALTAQLLQQCQELGVKIAIDDFGTGYSSLAYLKRFTVNVLKIDITFIRDILVDRNDYEIVRTIINLGQSMEIELVAEGIETEAQKESLLELGCEFGQGFLFSKPLTDKQFFQYLDVK